jgi:squalene-hopene/tetraprenyl-beta-curcumene cyclase
MANACELLALARSGYAARVMCASRIHASLERLLDAHQRDGGWCETRVGEPQGPSCPVVTACVLEALGAFGFRLGQPLVANAVKYIFSQQEETGLWADTRQVFAGLAAIGYDMTAMPLRRAVRRLKDIQNEDGGWGTPRSTVAATANGVLALLVADEPESAEVRAGVEFLVGTQRADGLWNAANSWVLHAVGRYARSVGALGGANLLGALGCAEGSALPAPHAA